MGFQFDVIFIVSFIDDIIYVTDVEVCVEHMICYIPGCICYGSENFRLGSLYVEYVGLAGATPQFYSVAPYRFDYQVRKYEFSQTANKPCSASHVALHLAVLTGGKYHVRVCVCVCVRACEAVVDELSS